MIFGKWGETITRGRKAIATIHEMRNIIQKIHMTPGRVFGEEELKQQLHNLRKTSLMKQNIAPIGQLSKISESSCTNYKTTAGCLGNISFVSNSVIKSNTRYTAEHSLMSTMSFLHTIATTHYRVFNPEKTNATYIHKQISDGAKELLRRVKDANHNRPINIVRPQYLFSTDNTTEYIFTGVDANRRGKWSLVSNEGIQNSSHKAIYKVTKKSVLLGMRVKLTFTLSAIGGMAPLLITVPYLTEHELIKADGFLPLKIKGLCIGGGGLDPHNEGFGYLLFTRRSNPQNNIDVKRTKYYRQNILIPYIRAMRKVCDGWNEGEPVPDELHAVSWCDGDISNLKTVIDAEGLKFEAEENITSNKHSAAKSAGEQPCDLSKVFLYLKRTQKQVTIDTYAVSWYIRDRIHAALKEHSHELNLRERKLRTLLTFLSTLPRMLSNVAKADIIIDGFVACGMLDAKTKTCPDMDQILATCHRSISIDEHKLCRDTFEKLYQLHFNEGHVSDDIYEEMGYPQDEDITGSKVRRDATIKRECFQRAKCLSHPFQKTLRKQLTEVLQAQEHAKRVSIREKFQKLLYMNILCETSIFQQIQQRQNNVVHDFEVAEIRDFEKARPEWLKSFIHCRLFETPDGHIKAKYKYPNKGRVKNCVNHQHDCLLQRAFDQRNAVVKLSVPQGDQNVFLYDDDVATAAKEREEEEYMSDIE